MAFSVNGNTVYLIYDFYILLYKEDVGIVQCPTSGKDYNTQVVYYSDNSVYVDICEITSDHNLKRLDRQRIENAMPSSEQHPQHLSGMRVGEDLILLISYDDGYTGDHVHRGGGVLAYNVTEEEKMKMRALELKAP